MVRRKDQFWEYVNDLNGRFKCNYCEREFSGGISRIKSHLSGEKGHGIDICISVPKDVQAAAIVSIGGPCKKAKTANISSNLEDNGTISASSNYFLKMSEIHEKDKSLVDKKLAQFIISNNIAFNVVEAPSFIDFVRSTLEFGLDYELPSYSTLTTNLIPGFAVEVGEYVEQVKKSWALTGCTLMLEICCVMNKQAIMNVIAYSPRGAVFMNSSDISKHQKNDVHLTGIVSSVIEDIGTHHVVQLITSKATIFESVGDMLKSKYPQIYKTRCVACEIQSLLKDIYDKVEWVNEIIDDAKSIVNNMNEDTIIYSLIRQHKMNRELKHPCMTKFASTYTMLQSIFDNENELQLLVASAEWRELDDNKKEIAEKITDIIFNRNFWSQGQEVLLVLKPIVQVLCLVEGDGSTSGYLYEAMERAEAAIKQRCGCNILAYEPILKLFEERRDRIIHPIHAFAAFLNPAYMCSENFKEDQKMMEGRDFMVENLVAGEEQITFLDEVQCYRMQVPKLFTKTAKLSLKAYHPRVWWETCGGYLPILKKYAIRILSQPSNSSCEKRWNAFEVAQTKKMNKQTNKMSENFVYVRMNTMIMEKFNTLEEQCWKPIHLEKCNELPDYVDLEQHWEDDSAELINENFDNKVMNEANPICSNCQALTEQTRREKLRESIAVFEERCLEPTYLKKCNELANYVDLEQGWEDDSADLINENFDNNVMNEANTLCSDRQEQLRRETLRESMAVECSSQREEDEQRWEICFPPLPQESYLLSQEEALPQESYLLSQEEALPQESRLLSQQEEDEQRWEICFPPLPQELRKNLLVEEGPPRDKRHRAKRHRAKERTKKGSFVYNPYIPLPRFSSSDVSYESMSLRAGPRIDRSAKNINSL